MINFTAVQSIGGLCNVKEGLVLLVSHFGFLGCVLEVILTKRILASFTMPLVVKEGWYGFDLPEFYSTFDYG